MASPSLCTILRDHVTLSIRSFDRLYLKRLRANLADAGAAGDVFAGASRGHDSLTGTLDPASMIAPPKHCLKSRADGPRRALPSAGATRDPSSIPGGAPGLTRCTRRA